MENILFLFSDIGIERGGIEVFNLGLVKAVGRGDVIALSDFGKHGILAKARFVVKVARHLFTQPTGHVVCGHVNLAPVVAKLCDFRKIPYSVVLHGTDAWIELPRAKRNALAGATSLLVVSRYTRDRCAKANHLPLEKFVLVPNTVDGDHFTPGPKPTDIVERFGILGRKVILTVARLDSRERQKGMDTVIRALPEIRKTFPNICYVIVGAGDDGERLKALAAELGVTDLLFFAGRVSRVVLPRFYRLADAFVMPSAQEGFGVVYLEALATGVPVVAGQDGASEPLEDGRLGWQVPNDSPAQVAKACLEALAGKDPRCQSDWLRREVLKSFGWDRFQRAVASAFHLSPIAP